MTPENPRQISHRDLLGGMSALQKAGLPVNWKELQNSPGRRLTEQEAWEVLRRVVGSNDRNLAERIEGQIKSQIAKVDTDPGKVSFKDVLANPKVGMEILGAVAEEAEAKAEARIARGRAKATIARVAGNVVASEAHNQRIEQLEKLYQEKLPVYCQERGIPVPQKESFARQTLLLELDARFRVLARKAGEVQEQAEKLVKKDVGLEKKIAERGIDVKRLPILIPLEAEANRLEQERFLKQVYHRLSSVSGGISVGITGLLGGIVGGFSEGLKNLSYSYPVLGLALGVSVGSFGLETIGALEISGPPWQTLAVRGACYFGLLLVEIPVTWGVIRSCLDKRRRSNSTNILYSKNILPKP